MVVAVASVVAVAVAVAVVVVVAGTVVVAVVVVVAGTVAVAVVVVEVGTVAVAVVVVVAGAVAVTVTDIMSHFLFLYWLFVYHMHVPELEDSSSDTGIQYIIAKYNKRHSYVVNVNE